MDAPNLVRFEFIDSKLRKLIFKHVPQLQTIYLRVLYEFLRIYPIRRTLAKDLPQLKSLSVYTEGDFFQGKEIYAFRNLRRLDFSLCYRSRIDLLSMIPFLQNCPLLQEFHMDANSVGYSGEQVRKDRAVVLHKELQRVEITGFEGTENEMEFASDIVKSAVALEKMHIFRCGKRYNGLNTWDYRDERSQWKQKKYEMIHKQLKEEAISSKAQIVVQSALLHENNLWS